MKFLDLFSGVGMYAKGLEDAGHEVIGFCERTEYCKGVLKKHWPTKPISSSIELLIRELMPSLAAGRVRMRRLPIAPPRQALKVNAQDFGQDYLEPFAWYDQSSSCWRTWQSCLIGGWAEFSDRWPQSGMIVNGIAYAQKTLVCRIREKDFLRLPTPPASEFKGTHRKRYRNSREYHGAKTSEALRICIDDPTYLNPSFAELMFGLEPDFTLLETETRQKSSDS